MRTSERYAPDAEVTDRINATLLALVRNEEADAMVQSMEDLERTWNGKFNYPWTFFNDKPFDEEFKRKTRAATKAQCNYGRSTLMPLACSRLRIANRPCRNHPNRALGDPILDRRPNIRRINPRSRRQWSSVCQDDFVSSNVPLE